MILVVASSAAELQAFSPPDPSSVVAVSVGVGLVHAAVGTYEAIMRYRPSHVVGVGTCCGITEQCSIGDIIMPSQVIQYDVDLRRFGLKRGQLIGRDGARTDFLPIDPLPFWPHEGVNVYEDHQIRCTNRIGSADRFFIPEMLRQAPWIRDELDLVAIDMESYAMVAASRMANVPITIVRAVSDLSSGERSGSLPQFLAKMSRIIRDMILNYSDPREKSPISL